MVVYNEGQECHNSSGDNKELSHGANDHKFGKGYSKKRSNVVRNWLDEKFLGHWLGRRGPHEWPARSPDLTPNDFFLWGWTKYEVYRTKPRTLDKLEAQILEVLANIPHNFLQKSVDSLVNTTGAYIKF